MTTFSIIIPTYNRRDHLMTCLASVFAQRRPPYEIIIVDDGSTDGTLEALAGLTGLTVIAQSNAGPGAARNRGAAAATGDYLVFLDSDDLWFPWTLDVISTLVERHGRPTLVVAHAEDFSGDLRVPREQAAEGMPLANFLHASAHAFIAGAGMMTIDRRAFCALGGFVEDGLNAEDHDLVLRLGNAPGVVQIQRPVTLARRIHAGNETANLRKSIDGIERLINRERAEAYPGGDTWKYVRRSVVTRHARPVVLQAAMQGELRAAWRLYRRTFAWNARAGRAGFIVAGPLLMLRAVLRSAIARSLPSTR